MKAPIKTAAPTVKQEKKGLEEEKVPESLIAANGNKNFDFTLSKPQEQNAQEKHSELNKIV